MNQTLCAIDWVKVARVASALLTPAIAIWIGIITSRIQSQQVKTQRQQYSFGLIEKRMKVFNATLDFIALVLRDARIESIGPLTDFLRSTREHILFFGEEVEEYVDELYKKGLRLETIYQLSLPMRVMRPEDVPINAEILEWFAGQTAVATKIFSKYIDFREP